MAVWPSFSTALFFWAWEVTSEPKAKRMSRPFFLYYPSVLCLRAHLLLSTSNSCLPTNTVPLLYFLFPYFSSFSHEYPQKKLTSIPQSLLRRIPLPNSRPPAQPNPHPQRNSDNPHPARPPVPQAQRPRCRLARVSAPSRLPNALPARRTGAVAAPRPGLRLHHSRGVLLGRARAAAALLLHRVAIHGAIRLHRRHGAGTVRLRLREDVCCARVGRLVEGARRCRGRGADGRRGRRRCCCCVVAGVGFLLRYRS